MDFSEFSGFLSGRCSVREFEQEPLADEEITSLVAAAQLGPSAGNLEAWDVVVVTDEDARQALSDAAFGQAHVAAAPALFVVCANYIRSMSQYGERGILYAVEDATIACTYMMLAARARGLSSCWTGAFEEDEVREYLGLPAHIRPLAILAVGKSSAPVRRAEHMDIENHIHYNTW
jgi:nitroreductase